MTVRTSLARLVRRDPGRPTLRERAATLRVSASRILHRRRDPDPIVAVIASHREMFFSPPTEGQEAVYAEAMEAADARLKATVPTTVAGLRALAAYLRSMSEEMDDRGDIDPFAATVAMSVLERFHSRAKDRAPAIEPTTTDTVLCELIEAHRAARQEFRDACPDQDEIAVKQAGGDTSDEAMAPARERYERTDRAERAAWDELIAARPRSLADLAAWASYIVSSPAFEDDAYATDRIARVVVRHLGEVCAATAASAPIYQETRDAPTDWASPPRGFIAYPSLYPSCFMALRAAIPKEAFRLFEIAQAEFERRERRLAVRPDLLAELRRDLRLDELRAAAFGQAAIDAERGPPPAHQPAGNVDPLYPADRSDPVFAAYDAHQRAYSELIAHPEFGEATDGDNARNEAEEAAFKALLHTPLTTDAGRLCYALAVIEHETGAKSTNLEGFERGDPLPIACRSGTTNSRRPETWCASPRPRSARS